MQRNVVIAAVVVAVLAVGAAIYFANRSRSVTVEINGESIGKLDVPSPEEMKRRNEERAKRIKAAADEFRDKLRKSNEESKELERKAIEGDGL